MVCGHICVALLRYSVIEASSNGYHLHDLLPGGSLRWPVAATSTRAHHRTFVSNHYPVLDQPLYPEPERVGRWHVLEGLLVRGYLIIEASSVGDELCDMSTSDVNAGVEVCEIRVFRTTIARVDLTFNTIVATDYTRAGKAPDVVEVDGVPHRSRCLSAYRSGHVREVDGAGRWCWCGGWGWWTSSAGAVGKNNITDKKRSRITLVKPKLH